MQPSKPLLLLVLLASNAAQADWDGNDVNWLVSAPKPPAREQRTLLAPEHFRLVQADGNFVAPQYQAGEELKLMEAVRANDVEAARTLLKAGVDANAQDYWGDTPLLQAVRRDSLEMALLLLDQGVAVNTKGHGYTPLGLAAKNGNIQLVRFLLRAGADPDRKNDDGNTPLHSAVVMGDAHMVAALTRAHPDMTLFNSEGLTALGLAVTTEQYDCAEALILGGAPLDAGDKKFRPPMFLAFAVADFDMLRLLLKHGADPGDLPVEGLK